MMPEIRRSRRRAGRHDDAESLVARQLERLRVDFGATRAKYFRIAWRGARTA